MDCLSFCESLTSSSNRLNIIIRFRLKCIIDVILVDNFEERFASIIITPLLGD